MDDTRKPAWLLRRSRGRVLPFRVFRCRDAEDARHIAERCGLIVIFAGESPYRA